MSNPRHKRMSLDAEKVYNRFRGWRPIVVSGASGSPPDRYQITYNLVGLYAQPDGKIAEKHQHVAEIELTLGYPRRAPQCRMLTPIFHPNFDQATICIGDFWAASEGLDDLIIRIGRMIAYQEYNVKSPLNGLAAKWAAEHQSNLPVDRTEVAPPSTLEPEAGDRIVLDSRARIHPEPVSARDDSQATRPKTAPLSVPASQDRNGPSLIAPNFEFSIPDGLSSLGSDPQNHVVVEGSAIEPIHASLYFDGNGVLVRDCSTTAGIYLNGRRTAEAWMRPGDRLKIGDFECRFALT